MTTDITKRVARGVKWLDRHVPGWEKRVELPEFNIKRECQCVLGQVFASTHGTYSHTLKELNDEGVISRRHANACGFDVLNTDWDDDHGNFKVAYDQLQREWKRVIRERKGGKK